MVSVISTLGGTSPDAFEDKQATFKKFARCGQVCALVNSNRIKCIELVVRTNWGTVQLWIVLVQLIWSLVPVKFSFIPILRERNLD